MDKASFLACVALTLAFIAEGAPTWGSSSDTQLQLEQLMQDLRLLQGVIRNDKNAQLSRMLVFKFYVPREVTELKHLQCLIEELRALEDVLNLAQGKNFHLRDIKESMSNINVTAQKLKGPETRFVCDYDDEATTVVEFLTKWITFCQSIFSTLT